MSKFRKKQKKLLKTLNTIKVLLIAASILVLALLLLDLGYFEDLAKHFLIVLSVLIIFELFTRRHFKDEMAVTVAEAINADVDFLREKMGGKVDSIIENCLAVKLCDKEMASMFFDGLVSPYLDIEQVIIQI